MPKVAQESLTAFGREVKRARSLKGWTLDELGGVMKSTSGKSFLSNIEKGKRDISARTAGRLIAALNLDEKWIDVFLDTGIAAGCEETTTDREADALLRLADSDATAPPTAEDLLIALAEDFAQGSHLDLTHAYNGLRAALMAAADIKARGALPQNSDDQLQAVMREVARLNDLGERDGAAEALQCEMARLDAEAGQLKAARETIFRLQLDQDRIRNAPKNAFERLVAKVELEAKHAGRLVALSVIFMEWYDRGTSEGLKFDVEVALLLAEACLNDAVGDMARASALLNLGNVQVALFAFDRNPTLPVDAEASYRKSMKLNRKRDTWIWGMAHIGLSNAIMSLALSSGNLQRLQEAIAAAQVASDVFDRADTPAEWGRAQNALGSSLQNWGERISGPPILEDEI